VPGRASVTELRITEPPCPHHHHHHPTMNPDHLQGLQVIDAAGEKVGKAVTVYVDVEHSEPEWPFAG